MIISAMMRISTINRIVREFTEQNMKIHIRVTDVENRIGNDVFRRVIINAPMGFDVQDFMQDKK